MDDLKLFAKSEKGLDSLAQTVHGFSNDIVMKFGIDKCAMVVLKRGKVSSYEGIKLADKPELKYLEEGDSYKYLGILELD